MPSQQTERQTGYVELTLKCTPQYVFLSWLSWIRKNSRTSAMRGKKQAFLALKITFSLPSICTFKPFKLTNRDNMCFLNWWILVARWPLPDMEGYSRISRAGFKEWFDIENQLSQKNQNSCYMMFETRCLINRIHRITNNWNFLGLNQISCNDASLEH